MVEAAMSLSCFFLPALLPRFFFFFNFEFVGLQRFAEVEIGWMAEIPYLLSDDNTSTGGR